MDFVHRHSVVLLHALFLEGIYVSLRGPLIKLFIQEPARKVHESDLNAHVQKTRGAVYADKS